jgi:pantetheine-phosphate adenylyltransferase
MTLDQVKRFYNSKKRVFHNWSHVIEIIEKIKEHKLKEEDENILIVSAVFHDLIYDVSSETNEIESANYFDHSVNQKTKNSKKIKDIILSTKDHFKHQDSLTNLFLSFDLDVLNGSISSLIQYEEKIFKEFESVSYDVYLKNRIDFLNSIKKSPFCKSNEQNLDELINIIKSKKRKIGIFPGSFNPFHIGHLNVLQKAEKIFDKVIIAIGQNPAKSQSVVIFNTKSSLSRRLNNEIVIFYGSLVEFVHDNENENVEVSIIRGLRNEKDLNFEMIQRDFIHDIDESIETVFILCDKQFSHISSSYIKQLENIDKIDVKKYIV